MVDIVLAVLLGLVTLVTAYLGVHVTLHPAESPTEKRAYKVGFILCGAFACVLIGIQTYRNNSAQEQLHAQISRIQNDTVRIEHNTEQPPRVEVNVPPSSVVLQDRAPSHDRPSNDHNEKIRSLSNVELKKESMTLAKRMKQFQRDLIIRASSFSDMMVSPNGVKAPENERVKSIYADGITVYNQTMLSKATALRAELWRRVGPVTPDDSMEAFAPLPTEADYIDVEHVPITNAANYLEKLAKRLPK